MKCSVANLLVVSLLFQGGVDSLELQEYDKRLILDSIFGPSPTRAPTDPEVGMDAVRTVLFADIVRGKIAGG